IQPVPVHRCILFIRSCPFYPEVPLSSPSLRTKGDVQIRSAFERPPVKHFHIIGPIRVVAGADVNLLNAIAGLVREIEVELLILSCARDGGSRKSPRGAGE